MHIVLSTYDKRALNGEFGRRGRLAMSIMIRVADVYGATELMDVTQAHVNGCALMSDSNLAFVETLSACGGRVYIPTTTITRDFQNWQRLGMPKDFAAKVTRLANAYTDNGVLVI